VFFLKPLVSVRVITYNHEKYIAKCLEGILMQKTNFAYEVIVGEDCSRDKTREIVLDYQKRYPDIIKVIISEKNIGPVANSLRVEKASQGAYHALCEGDDFWIDPLKLQRQVDFLEANPNYSMCCHDAISIWENKVSYPRYSCPNDFPDTLTAEDIILRPEVIQTASMVLRSEVSRSANNQEWRDKIWCGDTLTKLWALRAGKIKYINEIMSIYRRHGQGLSITIRDEMEREESVVEFLYHRFDEETNYQYAPIIEQIIETNRNNYKYSRLRIKYGPLAFLMRPDKTVKKVREVLDFVKQSRGNVKTFV
jgi:glycosyltransferase involved in cell wall biosynthesis